MCIRDRVMARQINANISANGGTVELCYDVQIENCEAGMVEYYLEIWKK